MIGRSAGTFGGYHARTGLVRGLKVPGFRDRHTGRFDRRGLCVFDRFALLVSIFPGCMPCALYTAAASGDDK